MINHIRTLLYGRRAADPSLPGHELLDPAFFPGELVGELARADAALFGRDSDNFGRNYWLRQYLQILHAPEVWPWVADFDTRISYLPLSSELFQLLRGQIPRVTGSEDVLFVGSHVDSLEGRLYRRWDVEATATNVLRVNDGSTTTTPTVSWGSGLSDTIALPNSNLLFRFRGSSVTTGTQFRIETFSQPRFNLADVPNRLLAALTPAELFSIFEQSPDQYAVWQSETSLTQQLGAFLAAYVRKLESRRGGVK